MMWPFKKQIRIRWPLPETDYEGNDLWELRFPKPKKPTLADLEFARAMQSMVAADYQKQAMNRMYVGMNYLIPCYNPLDWIYGRWGM